MEKPLPKKRGDIEVASIAVLANGREMAPLQTTKNGFLLYFSYFSMVVSIFHVKCTECKGHNCIIPDDDFAPYMSAASFAHAWYILPVSCLFEIYCTLAAWSSY